MWSTEDYHCPQINRYYFVFIDFQTKCPFGKKTKLYKKAKLEKFADYLLKDGLSSRLSITSDYECKTRNFAASGIRDVEVL